MVKCTTPFALRARALVLVLAVACGASLAGPTPAPVRAEIDALLTKLQGSGCQFSRNGSWYDGAKARDHLLRKLEAIERRGTVQSTEQFITLAATGSSISGKPYLVRCAGVAPVESQQWLTRQLAGLRGGAGKAEPRDIPTTARRFWSSPSRPSCSSDPAA